VLAADAAPVAAAVAAVVAADGAAAAVASSQPRRPSLSPSTGLRYPCPPKTNVCQENRLVACPKAFLPLPARLAKALGEGSYNRWSAGKVAEVVKCGSAAATQVMSRVAAVFGYSLSIAGVVGSGCVIDALEAVGGLV
jgi:hypothetical protein